jgi:hypothetical protein
VILCFSIHASRSRISNRNGAFSRYFTTFSSPRQMIALSVSGDRCKYFAPSLSLRSRGESRLTDRCELAAALEMGTTSGMKRATHQKTVWKSLPTNDTYEILVLARLHSTSATLAARGIVYPKHRPSFVHPKPWLSNNSSPVARRFSLLVPLDPSRLSLPLSPRLAAK